MYLLQRCGPQQLPHPRTQKAWQSPLHKAELLCVSHKEIGRKLDLLARLEGRQAPIWACGAPECVAHAALHTPHYVKRQNAQVTPIEEHTERDSACKAARSLCVSAWPVVGRGAHAAARRLRVVQHLLSQLHRDARGLRLRAAAGAVGARLLRGRAACRAAACSGKRHRAAQPRLIAKRRKSI